MTRATSLQEVQNLFFKYEDSLARSGLLLRYVPDYVGVQLEPEFYAVSGSFFLKCNIGIEVVTKFDLDESRKEDIADAVSDWLRLSQIHLALEKIGIKSDEFDWLTVSLIEV